VSKRQLKPGYQELKSIMSRIVKDHGGQVIDDPDRGAGIHTTYTRQSVKVTYTWHLSPSDTYRGSRNSVATLRKLLRKLGIDDCVRQLTPQRVSQTVASVMLRNANILSINQLLMIQSVS
jgi:hypothetical protein